MTRLSLLEKLEETYPVDLPKKYTAKDYFNLPEGSPYQLIEGKLIMTPSPLTEHQAILRNLGVLIANHLKKIKLGYVYYAPIDVYLDNKNAYQPDIIFISNENKDIIKKRGIDGPPDLVIEILSPSNEYYDIKIKKEVYEKSGVLEYIIVDPKAKSVEVFRRTGGNLKTNAALEKWDEVLSAKLDDNGRIYIKTLDLTIDLNDIFTEI
jgi:Uma2 family endonuclease